MTDQLKITLEQTEDFHSALCGEKIYIGIDDDQGGYDQCLEMDLGLTPQKAFKVIWFLQEIWRIIPDTFEMCDVCHSLYDSYESGWSLNDGTEHDEWYEGIGVSAEMLTKLDGEGGHFCSSECEAGWWYDRKNKT